MKAPTKEPAAATWKLRTYYNYSTLIPTVKLQILMSVVNVLLQNLWSYLERAEIKCAHTQKIKISPWVLQIYTLAKMRESTPWMRSQSKGRGSDCQAGAVQRMPNLHNRTPFIPYPACAVVNFLTSCRTKLEGWNFWSQRYQMMSEGVILIFMSSKPFVWCLSGTLCLLGQL